MFVAVNSFLFLHAFVLTQRDFPLCLVANLFGGRFCVGRPRSFVFSLLVSLAKRKSGWGIFGSSGVLVPLCYFFVGDYLPLI